MDNLFKFFKNKNSFLNFGLGFALAVLILASAKTLTFDLESLPRHLKQIIDEFGSKYLFFPKSKISPEVTLENKSSPLPVPQEIVNYEEQIVRVVEKSAPSVVSIVVTKDLPILEQYYVNPFEGFGFELPEGFGVPQYRQKGIERKEIGGGTGFIVASNGLIVTNKHVVADVEAEYTVIFNDGQKIPAKVIARDPNFDLAILRVEKNNLTPLPLGDSDKLKLAKTVVAIGNALGEFKNTVSLGVVSGLNRSIDVGNESLTGLIQTDAGINQGNSGGPLLNLAGEVIGINTAMAQGAENIGFAIPINQVKKAIYQVEKSGSLSLAYLGVRYRILTPEIKKVESLEFDYGAQIKSSSDGSDPGVVPYSPAKNAGIKEGDIILSLNGTKITKDLSLAQQLRDFQPGDKVSLKIWRDKKEITIEVVLGER